MIEKLEEQEDESTENSIALAEAEGLWPFKPSGHTGDDTKKTLTPYWGVSMERPTRAHCPRPYRACLKSLCLETYGKKLIHIGHFATAEAAALAVARTMAAIQWLRAEGLTEAV